MHNSLSVLTLLLFCSLTAGAQEKVYPSFIQAPKESYVKSMKSVFEDIHLRKWEKAQKDYNKVEEKSASAKEKHPEYTNTQMQALYPLPQIAMAVFYSTENTHVPTMTVDYDKAYYMLKQGLTFKDKDGLNNFLNDPDVSLNLNMLEDRIEEVLCNKATKANTEQAYDAVIDSLWPQSLQYQTMKMQREQVAFDNVSKTPTEAECLRFLDKYTDALTSRRTSVTHDLDSIRYSAIDGSIASLEKYISQYPNSTYLKTAQNKLEDMEYALIDSTAASCKKFLDKYPSSQHFMEVKKRYNTYTYNEAIKNCTAEAYQNFCKEFPYDLHYQNVFDTLLCRTLTQVYDTIFAGGKPDVDKYLSSEFAKSVKNRDAAEAQMKANSLIPPARRDIWTGLKNDYTSMPYNCMEILEIDLKSKTNASVHVTLTDKPHDNALVRSVKEVQSTLNAAKSGTVQSDIYYDFIFEGNDLKIDDIRLDDGKSSQR